MEQLVSLYQRWVQLPRWQRWLSVILLGAFLFAAIYYFHIAPLKETLEEKEREARSLSMTVNRLRIAEGRKKKLERKVEEVSRKIAQLEGKLPTGREEVAQILRSIAKADGGMTVEFIRKETPRERDYYVEYPYVVGLVGTYPGFIRWCERLSKANRILNFGNLEVESLLSLSSSAKEREEVPKGATVRVNLEVKAFTLKEVK